MRRRRLGDVQLKVPNIPSILCRIVCIFPLHLYLHRRCNCIRGSGCDKNCKIRTRLHLCTSNRDIFENYRLVDRLDTLDPFLFDFLVDFQPLCHPLSRFFCPIGRPEILYCLLVLDLGHDPVLNRYDIFRLQLRKYT